MSMYRLRSLYALLDGFHELENQEIYFAPYDELNDPLEGSVEMFWHGDAIVWKNLFRHYLLCLYYQFVMATIIGKDFCNEDFPIMISEFGSAEGIINIFQNIKKQFFAREAIQKLIQFLSSRVSNIKQQELTFWLKTIQCFAFSCVVSACNKAGLYENNSILSLLSKFDELDRYSEILDITPPDVDDSEVVFQYFNQGIDQTTTLLKLKAEEA
ncbi:MAG: hypothetical protein LBG83_00435, partial [Oscillospiraceae bacterium]|nr:hypothetical protein [Oscillospiraceae bacterium]